MKILYLKISYDMFDCVKYSLARTSHLPSDVLGSFKCNSPWDNRNPHAPLSPFLVAQLNLCLVPRNCQVANEAFG